MNRLKFVERHMQLLESLFGIEWFARPHSRHHPAFQRWALCKSMLEHGGGISLNSPEPAAQFAEIILDGFGIVSATRGIKHEFIIGDLANYGDERVRRRLKAIIYDPRQFLDLLVELNYAAWNLNSGHCVSVYESEGFPDFEIRLERDGTSWTVAADCKRILKTTGTRRLSKIVAKANGQIKNLQKVCYGLVVIDISEWMLGQPASPDTTPEIVESVCQTLRQCLHTDNSSVSGALVTWKEAIAQPMTNGSGGVLHLLQQRSRIVRHANPLRVLPQDDRLFRLEQSIVSQVLPRGPST